MAHRSRSSAASAASSSTADLDAVYNVSAIADWRYSRSEHAAAALLDTPKRPDMFELVWDTEQRSKPAARSRKQRTWEPISNITGGYASPLVQSFLRKHYLPARAPAAAAADADAGAGAKKVRPQKRHVSISRGQLSSSKRPKKAAAAAASRAGSEPSTTAVAAPAVTAREEYRHSTALSAAAAAAATAIGPRTSALVAADSQALTARRPSLLSRQLSNRSTRSSLSAAAAAVSNAVGTSATTATATAARIQIEQLVTAALEDELMSAADVLFFNELVKLLYPAAPLPPPQVAATAVTAAAAVIVAPLSLSVTRAGSMLSQATQLLTSQQC